MHLKRVRVPNFRALKDVDITFEPEFFPKIFPLGSVNGGGKSTLLQLIFILLHCATDPEKVKFVKNILSSFIPFPTNLKGNLVASLEISDEYQKIVKLDFLLLDLENIPSIPRYIPNEKVEKNKQILENDRSLNSLTSKFLELDADKIKEEINRILLDVKQVLESRSLEQSKENTDPGVLELMNSDLTLLNKKLNLQEIKLKSLKKEFQSLNELMHSHKMRYLCHINDRDSLNKSRVLLCKYEGIADISPNDFFESLSQKNFLAAPSTQIFLFLDPNLRKNLFKSSDLESRDIYHQELEQLKLNLDNFYSYNFMSIDLILNAFKKARDLDFAEKVKSGHYGQNYEKLLNELNALLGSKQVNVEPDLSGIKFFIEREGEQIELYPEDLSHGELKRLNLYLWLKLNNIKDSIVLIDEIEIALHPDWQYQIVRDFEEWEPSNQYILATHSYELCQALTPAHVKELEPRLIKSNTESAQPHY